MQEPRKENVRRFLIQLAGNRCLGRRPTRGHGVRRSVQAARAGPGPGDPVGIPGAPGAPGSSGGGGEPSGPCVWGPESLALELSQGLRISGYGDGLVQRDCPTGSL